MQKTRVLLLIVWLGSYTAVAHSQSLIVDGREWLQPFDFGTYSWNDVNAVCPNGRCVGRLPGSNVDLTGYIWASVDEINALVNAFGPPTPLGPGPTRYRGPLPSQGPPFFVRPWMTNFYRAFPPYDGRFDLNYHVLTRDLDLRGNIFFFRLDTTVGINSNGGLPTFFTEEVYSTNERFGDKQNGAPALGHFFWRPFGNDTETRTQFTVVIEEPIKDQVHSGVGTIRGWAIAPEGIDRIELRINGRDLGRIPFGGDRADIAASFPDIEMARDSGFSFAFAYSNLEEGFHTISARAFSAGGRVINAATNFAAIGFDEPFIAPSEPVDTTDASVTLEGDVIRLRGVEIGDQVYDLKLQWRTAEQGFEIVEIQ